MLKLDADDVTVEAWYRMFLAEDARNIAEINRNFAEAALRDMTEQRDRAWEAGIVAAAKLVIELNGTLGSVNMAEQIAALMPPSETAAKEIEPADHFGAHLTEPLGTIDGRVIGAGHVVLSEERYAWLMRRAGLGLKAIATHTVTARRSHPVASPDDPS